MSKKITYKTPPFIRQILILLIIVFTTKDLQAQNGIEVRVEGYYLIIACDTCSCNFWTYSVYNLKQKKYVNTSIILGAKTKEETKERLNKKKSDIQMENIKKGVSGGFVQYDYDYDNVIGPYCEGTLKDLSYEIRIAKNIITSPEFQKATIDEKQKIFDEKYKIKMNELQKKIYNIPRFIKTDGGRRG